MKNAIQQHRKIKRMLTDLRVIVITKASLIVLAQINKINPYRQKRHVRAKVREVKVSTKKNNALLNISKFLKSNSLLTSLF
jgi:Ni2+-binding GTPase involved in maturation of urease and hydrogenase